MMSRLYATRLACDGRFSNYSKFLDNGEAMNPIRVAIVGCGRISDLHQLGYRDCPDARIVAVCDSNQSRARKKAREWNVEKVYTDYQLLLEDKEVDLVEL